MSCDAATETFRSHWICGRRNRPERMEEQMEPIEVQDEVQGQKHDSGQNKETNRQRKIEQRANRDLMNNQKRSSRKSRILAVFLAAMMATGSLALAACGEQATETEEGVVTGALEEILTEEGVTLLPDEFLTATLESAGTIKTYTGYESEEYQTVQFNGATIDFQGSGAEVDGSDLVISSPGTYVITGTLDDGCIIVDSSQEENVTLVLNNASINCSDGASIFVKNCGKNVIISLPDGTSSTVVDGAVYTNEYVEDEEPSAAIYSNDDLRINGTGQLIIKGNTNDGIKCDDDLQIIEASLVVTAADDGIVGKDSVEIGGGDITVDAGGDGIKASNEEESEKGYIAIAAGSFNITAVNDGFQAESALLISEGDFKIQTGGGAEASSVSDGQEESDSAKALKASGNLLISGGTYSIDSRDDGVHSNGNVLVKGGILNIATGDDGIHGDAALGIGGGTVSVTKSYEGIESALIVVLDGMVDINSSDDGVNVAGGNSENTTAMTASTATTANADANTSATAVAGGGDVNGMDPRQQDQFDGDSSRKLIISGGTMTVNAEGDGIDVNGSAYMSAGTVTVNGPTSSGNGALDYSGVFEVSGGTLLAAGSAGMAQAPSEGSSQYAIAAAFDTKNANTNVRVEDENGKTVISFTPMKSYGFVVISSPLLEEGKTYTIKADGTDIGTATLDSIVSVIGTLGNGMMQHGPGGQGRPTSPDGGMAPGEQGDNGATGGNGGGGQ